MSLCFCEKFRNICIFGSNWASLIFINIPHRLFALELLLNMPLGLLVTGSLDAACPLPRRSDAEPGFGSRGAGQGLKTKSLNKVWNSGGGGSSFSSEITPTCFEIFFFFFFLRRGEIMNWLWNETNPRTRLTLPAIKISGKKSGQQISQWLLFCFLRASTCWSPVFK